MAAHSPVPPQSRVAPLASGARARRESTHDGVEQRAAKAAADAELRGSVDAAAQGAKQARDGLSQRLEQIEAAVSSIRLASVRHAR